MTCYELVIDIGLWVIQLTGLRLDWVTKKLGLVVVEEALVGDEGVRSRGGVLLQPVVHPQREDALLAFQQVRPRLVVGRVIVQGATETLVHVEVLEGRVGVVVGC